jgi:transcriptional regulator with XRE-family HTH domain/quercetin dioxygenase-like cupin family protein
VSEPKVPAIGPRIRAERNRRELTIRSLARDIGVSPSLISQIETGKSQPSVSTLYAITTALGLPLEELFDARDDETDGHGPILPVSPDDGALGYLGADRARELGPYVGHDDRELLTLDSGVTWQRLGQVPHHHVDFLLVTYEPGGASSQEGRLMRHSGTEYGYLVSGELELTLGFDKHVLTAGDAVCFESTTPHGYSNHGSVPAVGVWFVVEPG